MKKQPKKSPKVPGQVRLPGWKHPFVVYLADLPGQGHVSMAKVGFVHKEKNIRRRIRELKSAAMLYYPVPIAAFLVEPSANRTPQHAESCVHSHLRDAGIRQSGEIFLSPNACSSELVSEVHDALSGLGRRFETLDVQDLSCHFQGRNQSIRASLDGAEPDGSECPYAAFRKQFDISGFPSNPLRDWSPDRLREVSTLGFLLSDLFASSGHPSLAWDLTGFGRLIIFPPESMAEYQLEARAEQQLYLHSRGRTKVVLRGNEAPGNRSVSMQFISLDACGLSIPAPFLGHEDERDTTVRFSPEYMACLGDSAVIPASGSHYFAEGTRAPLSPEVFAVANAHPETLPTTRFLVGVMEALKQDVRIQDYALPREVSRRLACLPHAAELMAQAGSPIPDHLVRWIRHAWISGEEAFDARVA